MLKTGLVRFGPALFSEGERSGGKRDKEGGPRRLSLDWLDDSSEGGPAQWKVTLVQDTGVFRIYSIGE